MTSLPYFAHQHSDRLSDLIDAARALEMAIGGADSINSREKNALMGLAGKLVEEVSTIRDEVDSELETAAKEG